MVVTNDMTTPDLDRLYNKLFNSNLWRFVDSYGAAGNKEFSTVEMGNFRRLSRKDRCGIFSMKYSHIAIYRKLACF